MISRGKGSRRSSAVQGGFIGRYISPRYYASEQAILITTLSSLLILTLLLGVQLYLGFRMNLGIADSSPLVSHLTTKEEGRDSVRDSSPIVLLAGARTNTNIGPNLDPIFRCTIKPTFRRNKLIFVHVFKTAGSTIRNFFDAYSDWCFAGWAIVVLFSLALSGVSAAFWWLFERRTPVIRSWMNGRLQQRRARQA